MSPQKNQDAICHEIPQILIQAALMLQKNTSLKSNQSFALRVNGTKLQLSSAIISQSYIQNLIRDNPLGELSLFRSVPYDLRHPEERWELLRLLVGLLRHINAAGS